MNLIGLLIGDCPFYHFGFKHSLSIRECSTVNSIIAHFGLVCESNCGGYTSVFSPTDSSTETITL